MEKTSTFFNIQLLMHGDTPIEVFTVLEYLLQNRNTRKALRIPVPNHPFFTLPGWSDIFHRCRGRVSNGPKHTFALKVKGHTTLEEQDIGLFLRWLMPNIAPTGWRPKRVATVRSADRIVSTSLSYFVRNGELSICYVDDPVSQITNYQAAA